MIEALRYNDSQSGGKRKTKKSRSGASLSGMALANLGRNKKRTVTVICSLTLGLTLAASYIISALAVGIVVRAMVEGGYTIFRFTLLPLIICTPVLIAFAVIIPYICFKKLDKQSVVEQLRTIE